MGIWILWYMYMIANGCSGYAVGIRWYHVRGRGRVVDIVVVDVDCRKREGRGGRGVMSCGGDGICSALKWIVGLSMLA